MPSITFLGESIEVDAAIIAEGLGLSPARLQERMREGGITSLCERGIDADEGRYRLTFLSPGRSFRLVVDAQGNILERSRVDGSPRRRGIA
ncbi:MAG TPA: DUF6522 family protein [Methylovirgula sp.]|nr:DUF6522 family protein [Methylovirgula sp.]